MEQNDSREKTYHSAMISIREMEREIAGEGEKEIAGEGEREIAGEGEREKGKWREIERGNGWR